MPDGKKVSRVVDRGRGGEPEAGAWLLGRACFLVGRQGGKHGLTPAVWGTLKATAPATQKWGDAEIREVRHRDGLAQTFPEHASVRRL